LKPTLTVRRISPTEIQVWTPDDSLERWRESQRVEVPHARFTKQFQRGRWDGTKAPGKWCRRHRGGWQMRCSLGLAPRLLESFDLTGDPIGPQLLGKQDLDDLQEVLHLRDGYTLRDYQTEAIVEILRSRWGRIALATNAGKGAIIALTAEILRRRGIRSLILGDEVEVFQALKDECAEWLGWTPGLVEAGSKEPPDDPIVLAMVPTLARRIKDHEDEEADWLGWMESFRALFLDEADKATAKTWVRILRAGKNSEYRVGFSGSFPRGDPVALLDLEELMGGELTAVRNLELVERGISARPMVELRGIDVSSALEPRPEAEVWWKQMTGPERRNWVYERAILQNDLRHDYIARLLRNEVPTVIIVNRIEHGEALAEKIPHALFLDGSASKTRRSEALERFQAGDLEVLIATRIFDRGSNRLGHSVDLIFASGEGSSRQSLQRIGRGLRKAGDKEFLRLIDIVDRVRQDPCRSPTRRGKNCGRCEACWYRFAGKYLRTAGEKRIQLYAKEGFDVEAIREENTQAPAPSRAALVVAPEYDGQGEDQGEGPA